MCFDNLDCPGLQQCCSYGECCGDIYYDYAWGAGSIAGVVIGLIFLKILIVSCIVYYRRRRRAVPYMAVPNTTTVATVVQTNQQTATLPGNAYPYYPPVVPPQIVQVTANNCKPPAYSEVVIAPAQV